MSTFPRTADGPRAAAGDERWSAFSAGTGANAGCVELEPLVLGRSIDVPPRLVPSFFRFPALFVEVELLFLVTRCDNWLLPARAFEGDAKPGERSLASMQRLYASRDRS